MADEVAGLKVLITGDASDLQSAIAQTETALFRLEKVQNKSGKSGVEAVKNNTKAREDNTAAIEENTAATEESAKAVNVSSDSLEKNIKKSRESSSQNRDTAKSYKELGEGVDTLTKPLQTGAVVLAAGGVAAAKFAMDYESAFTGVRKTVDGTDAELVQLSDDIRQMALEIPVSAAELANLAAIGGQLGVPIEQMEKFTQTIAAMGVATNLSGENAASALARIVNVTGESMDNVDRIGSAIVALGNNSATTEAEIAEMAQRMGKFGNTVGINSHQVLAYSAALSSMGVEAQAGGSALGRVWMDIESAVQNGGAALKAYAKYAGESASEFKKQWSTDASGAFSKIIKGLSETENLTGALAEIGVENTIDQQSVMALANGYDKLTKSLTLSSEAYAENNSLTKEADAAYATTANQLQLAKNSIVEAGISFGEFLLPAVVDVTGNIKEFAQWIANLDEGTKQNIISIGKWVIGLGAVSKVGVGAIKGTGNVLEAIQKIGGVLGKTADAPLATKGIASIAPLIAKIAPVAGPAALAVAGIGVAAWGVKKGYDAWYDSQYRWSKGLSDGNDKIRESLDKYKQLSAIQGEIKDLKLVIENPESSQKQVETAQARLGEIKELLSDEYNLVIKSDNSNLDEAVETVKKINKNQTKIAVNEHISRMEGLRPKFDQYQSDYENLNNQLTAAIEKQDLYTQASLELSEVQSELKQGTYEYNRAVADIGIKYGLVKETAVSAVDVLASTTEMSINAKLKLASADIEDYNSKLTSLTSSYEEYIALATESANWETELLGLSALEGDAEGVSYALDELGALIRLAGLDLDGYAQAAALAMNGVESLESAWEQAANGDGTALNGVINDYIRASLKFGETAPKTAIGAAVIASGFRSIEEASKADGGIEKVNAKLNEISQTIEGFPDNTSIRIEANGDISFIDDTNEKVREIREIQTADGMTVAITAEGDVKVLDEAGNQVKYLKGINAVDLKVNAEGNIDIINQLGKIDTIPRNVNLIAESNTKEAENDIEKLNDKEVTISVDGDMKKVDTKISNLNGKTVTINADIKHQKEARGTSNFSGGLAMINDQRGVSDPRELVEFGGKGYIFEGRDVVLPLPEHAKVYTASQTKAIMAGRGIPHYAKGKDNEAFESAKADWSHYTKINDVSAAEELEHWNRMLEKFSYDTEAVKEIQEELFSATKRLWDEDLEAMEYALDMGEITTAEYYDELKRYRDENFAEGSEEYKKATLEMKDIGAEMYNDRLDASYEWLEHEKKYNNLSTEDYIAGLERMEAYTEEYYRDGRISYEEYIKAMGKLNDEKVDVIADAKRDDISDWEDSADWYYRQSEAYGWGFDGSGDTKSKFFGRKIDEYEELLSEGNLEPELYAEIQRSRDEALLDMYEAQSEELEEMLEQQKDAISDLESKMADEINDMRSKWSAEDRAEDMEEIQKKMELYEGAATLEGQEEYKRLQDELKKLEREEEIYRIEQENAEIISQLEEEYAVYAEEQREQLNEQHKLLREGINTVLDATTFTEQLKDKNNDVLLKIGEVIGAIKDFAEAAEQSRPIVSQIFNNNISDRTDVEAIISSAPRMAQNVWGGGY